MIHRLGEALSRVAARWIPDPFTIAIALTFVTLALAWAILGASPLDLVGNWGGRLDDGALLAKESGLWSLLVFAMQMCLILVTGHALASSPPVRRLVGHLARAPRTPAQAVALTSVVAMGFALVNWGLGLIVGALLARDVGLAARAKGMRVHYPLLGAAGYSGLLVWHGGLSGSAPLKVTEAGEMARLLGDANAAGLPLGATVFSPMNLVVTALLLVVVPLVLVAMAPRDGDALLEVDPDLAPAPEPPAAGPTTPASRLERSPLLAWLLGALAFTYLALYLGHAKMDLNAINLLFLALGVVLHASPRAYADAVGDAARGCAGIILQFPIYAGIMGIMVLSGLGAWLAAGIADAAGPSTLSPLTFLSAGLVNLFVPSGGGQWAVQGPIVVETARALDVPLGKAVMAFSYGDEWTNMLQPFWALPLLGITGLEARQLIGYTGALMLLVAPVYIGCLLIL